MNPDQPVKLLLDECLGRPIVADMNQMLSWDRPAPTIHHLTKYFLPGTKDEDWIPRIKNEGWVVLTQDKGRKGRHKLPKICALYKITHIVLSKAVAHQKQYQKANTIIGAWEQIKECANATAGTRFRLKLTHAGRAIIERVDLTPNV